MPTHVNILLVYQIVGSVAKSCLTLATPWTVARQAPLSMRFPRQEYWSGLFLLQGIFPTQGSNPQAPAWQVNSSPPSHLGSPCIKHSRTRHVETHVVDLHDILLNESHDWMRRSLFHTPHVLCLFPPVRHRPQLQIPTAEKGFGLSKVHRRRNLENESSLQLIAPPKSHRLGRQPKKEDWKGG